MADPKKDTKKGDKKAIGAKPDEEADTEEPIEGEEGDLEQPVGEAGDAGEVEAI